MKINEQLSMLLLLEKSKVSKDGTMPITIRLTVDSKRAELSLGLKIHPDAWNQEAGIAKGSSEHARAVNTSIDRARGKLRTQYDLLAAQQDYVSAAMVKAAYLGKKPLEEEKPKSISLIEATDFTIGKIEKKDEKKIRAKATLTKWKTTKDKILQFLEFSDKIQDMPLDKMTYSFAEDFLDFLMLEQDLTSNSAMKYVKNTKHVLKNAVSRGWLDKSPLAAFECSYVNPDRDILSEYEILEMYNKKMPSTRLDEIKDTYLFMCFTGYAYKDASILSPEHVCKFFDGEDWIIKNREKTWCRENVPLLPIAKEIIEKYRGHSLCLKGNLLLPVKSNQKFNDYLKEVAALCGIEKNLTTHTARHTFATTVTLSNGVPLETVSALLGHKSIRTTQIYAKIVAKKVSEDMSALKEKLYLTMPVSLQTNAA